MERNARPSPPRRTTPSPSVPQRSEPQPVDTSSLLWSVLFSSIGLGYAIYGKRQRAPVPLVCGVALMVFPYFVSSNIALVAIGAALMVAPYFIRL